MSGKELPAFWRNISPGSIITLSDEQSISDSMDRGEGIKGRDYVVASILKIEAAEEAAQWLAFNLEDEDQELYLIVKIVDQNLSIYVYFLPDEFKNGNRKELVESGETWIFNEPEDPEKFEYTDLTFSPEIIMNVEHFDDEGIIENIDILYQLKGQGVLFGSSKHEPVQTGLNRVFTTIAEYATTVDCENPEMIILEMGGENSPSGGLITMMLGCGVLLSEIDVLNLQAEAPVTRKKTTLWEKVIKKINS